MYQNRTRTNQSTQQRAHTQGQHTVHHDFESSATVTATIVHALSNMAGIDVTQAEFVLNDYVDPDALDRLFAPKSDGTPRTSGHVTFDVRGYQTTVYSNGQITIVPPQPNQPSTR